MVQIVFKNFIKILLNHMNPLISFINSLNQLILLILFHYVLTLYNNNLLQIKISLIIHQILHSITFIYKNLILLVMLLYLFLFLLLYMLLVQNQVQINLMNIISILLKILKINLNHQWMISFLFFMFFINFFIIV